MGKVLKSAKVAEEKYLVSVPEIERPTPGPSSQFGDDRYDSHFGAESHYDDFSLESTVAPQRSAPEPPPQQQLIDWDAVRADAEEIIDRAAADAERMIKETEAAALQMVAQAQAKASEIEASAQASGEKAGHDEGKRRAEEELTPVIKTLRELVESIRASRASVIASAEPELVRLAMEIAERIVHTEVAENKEVVVENVRNALTRLVTREVVTLRLNPADLETIRQYRDSIVAASDVEHLRMVEDQRVDRGGVVVETEAGTIDAKIATQLREAKRALLTEDAIALDTSSPDQELLHPSAHVS